MKEMNQQLVNANVSLVQLNASLLTTVYSLASLTSANTSLARQNALLVQQLAEVKKDKDSVAYKITSQEAAVTKDNESIKRFQSNASKPMDVDTQIEMIWMLML
ncbi:hypothetical protein MP228_006578 [Amoeboaphelidium protococcarum]|nr:hypothetical protein MP228_006578 [Amoeboaphelidium protococcarum]